MPKLGYGYALYPGSPSSLPSDISGLGLWLKADAGVKFGSYVKEITLTGAGSPTANGIYTRENAGDYPNQGLASFTNPNGSSIYWDNENNRWYLNDGFDGQSYSNFSPILADNWNVEGGASPAPNATYKFFSPSQNNISIWEDQSGNKNHFTGYNASMVQSAINGKQAIEFNAFQRCFFQSQTTLFNSLSSLSFIAVCKVQPDLAGENYFYDNKSGASFVIGDLDPGINVNIGGGFLSGNGINFFQSGAFHINYLDATTGNGSAYQDGQLSLVPFVSQIIISGAGDSTSNGTYTRASGGTTSFGGPNGNYIEWQDAWFLYDATQTYNTYVNYSIDFNANWNIENGAGPAPSASYTNSYNPAVSAGGITLPLQSGTSLVLGRNTMYLSELLIYNKRLSATERQQVEGYLNFKYAIY